MATASDPITRVSVISTGSVSIRPEHVGPTWKNLYVWLFTSRRWTAPRPINVYVVEHRDGLVLFDTGQDRASVTDPDYFPASGFVGLIYRRLARFDIDADKTLTMRLAALGYDVADVRTTRRRGHACRRRPGAGHGQENRYEHRLAGGGQPRWRHAVDPDPRKRSIQPRAAADATRPWPAHHQRGPDLRSPAAP